MRVLKELWTETFLKEKKNPTTRFIVEIITFKFRSRGKSTY